MFTRTNRGGCYVAFDVTEDDIFTTIHSVSIDIKRTFMDPQPSTNMVTWFIIVPIFLITAGLIIWSIMNTQASPWKRFGLAGTGLLAWIGFTVMLLGVYYRVNEAFAGSFRFYAYSALAPAEDPFRIEEGEYGPILIQHDVYKKNGQLRILQSPASDVDYSGYVFAPGKYSFMNIKDQTLMIPSDVSGSESNTTKTSLWWALTKDLTRLNVTAE